MNLYGYLMNQVRHRVKVNGFVLLPWDLTVGFDAYWSSPFRYSVFADAGDFPDLIPPDYIVRWEERGSRKGNSTYQLDLQVSKGFAVGPVRLQVIGTVINAFSTERPTSADDVCENYGGCGSASLGQPFDWQTPRRYEVGFRLEF
jgi:hypothetical protein